MGISELEISPGNHGQKRTVRGQTKFEKYRIRKLFESWTRLGPRKFGDLGPNWARTTKLLKFRTRPGSRKI